MVSKKEKCKRKKNLEALDDENSSDKYLAYVIKPKKKKKSAMESVADSSKIEHLVEKKKLKKKAKKIIDQEDSDCAASVFISAEPQLYQNKCQSKDRNKRSVKETSKFKGKNQKTLNDSLINCTADEATGIEFITPKCSMRPTKNGKEVPMVFKVPDKFDFEMIDDKDMSTFDYDMKPVVYEAHLKKPTSHYLPRVLKVALESEEKEEKKSTFKDQLASINRKIADAQVQTNDTISFAKKDIQNNSSKQATVTSKVIETLSSESNTNSETSVNNSPNGEQEDLNVPEALKDFYKEITQDFDDYANKSLGKNKKSKKKSALTVDESVKDERSLANIVSRNTFQMESTVSTYQQNMAQFFSLESKVILVLCPEAQFSFLGKLKVSVLYGAIELYGCLYNSQNTQKPVEVYSPRGYSSISISATNSDSIPDKEALWDFLTVEGVDRSLKTKLHDSIQKCTDGWVVLLLECFENTLTSFLNSYSSFKLFPRIDNMRYSWCDPKRAECILQAYFQFNSSAATDEISIRPQWNENVTTKLLEQWQLTKSMITMIIGGKGVGKSTTARYLINNLLRHSGKVVLLDLDIGQAEMTAPGSVSLSIIDSSLLGPNFTHLKTPYYQLYLEDVNVTNCMTRYIECAKKLIERIKGDKNLSQYPVFVNTMGFCKGIGLDICIFLIKLLQPSNIVQIVSKRPKNNFEFALLKQTINDYKTSTLSLGSDNAVFEKSCDYELHYVPSMAEGKRQFETWNMEPRQQRELVLLSYLSQIISNADDKNLHNFASNSINNIVPYTLPFSSFYIALLKSNISATHMLAAMNGNIVALCGIDLDEEISAEEKEALKYPMVVVKPPLCTCYGYGIVRGIDMNRRQIYINTPLKENELRSVNLLTGCTPVPFSLLHRDAPYAGDKGELPTSRQPRRGNFRVEQNRNV